ncbi:hypothetical protein [Nocardia terpenica]|uniref:hypothetical protein n=1 Tax=Nocardia terpenica TaxID=455432 RepID=UPI0012E8D8E5|nr:hypothetical protein [Nocardia terpenica]NQE89613.1 hypothetical protein [Nocardia terpenica]
MQDDRNVTHIFGPGDQVPNWAVEAITNPAVWAHRDDDPDPEPDGAVYEGEPHAARRGRKPVVKDAA